MVDMMENKDGSKSKKGLLDNIRAKVKKNKKTSAKPKKPTKQMLDQARKINKRYKK